MVDAIQNPNAYANSQKLSGDDATTAGEEEFAFFGEDGFSFWDFVDMVNPLQHIPVVSTAYRSMTGDEIDPGSRLAGGTLFGGPIGLAASTFNVILEHNTGKDAGEHVVAMFEGEEEPADDRIMLAENTAANGFAPPPMASGFAPIPSTEADAFAAGEASLRMADLYEFMNGNAVEVPETIGNIEPDTQSVGAGSAGTWSAPLPDDHPFPTERPLTRAQEAFTVSQAPENAWNVAQAAAVSQPQQYQAFQSKKSHDDNLAALRAFAQDVKTQQAQETVQVADQPSALAQPQAVNPAQLNRTDNSWFTQIMSQNMELYSQTRPQG